MVSKILLLAGTALFALNGCVTVTRTVATAPQGGGATASSAVTATCPGAGDLGSAYDAPIGEDAVNQPLLDEAIRHVTNRKRCAQGLAPLAADNGLRSIATGHSTDMAAMNFFAHDSPVPGKTKFVDRLRGAGVPYTAAAENIAYNSRLSIEARREFYAIDRANCQFTHDRGGSALPTHTYRTFAQKIVDDWEQSPEHRVNLLNPDFRRLGSGAATKANPVNCGDVYVTQIFAA